MVRLFLRRALACLVSSAIAFAACSVASAQAADGSRRIVVERFRGPRASRLRSALVANLEAAGWIVVDETIVWRTTRELGMSQPETREDYVRLAAALDARAFVAGTVSRSRRTWRLVVRVRNATNGEHLASEGWSGRTTSAMDGVGRGGATRLRPHLERTSVPGTAPPPSSVVPRQGDDDEEPPPLDDETPIDDEDADPEEPAPPSTVGRYDSFRLSLSAGSLWRSMSANATVYAVRRGQPAADPATALYDESRGYTSSGIGHAELGVEAELYPGALGDQVFPWLGVLVSFRHSVLVSSFGCRRSAAECAGDGRIEIGTEQLDAQAGLRGRYRVGDRRGDFQLMLEVLWGVSTFALDPTTLQLIDLDAIIPPVEHQYLSLGGGFEVALVPDALVVALRADYRVGLQIGARTREVWGIDTGPATGLLTGAELRHEATWLAEGAFVALRFEYFMFQTTYRGQVGCATPGGCPELPPDQQYMDDNLWEPWPVDASGNVVGGIRDTVTDHYVRWGVYLGYAFR
ncbi:hypothetical protein [Sandaracinus amylolyticus]|uniref:Uncharacterized protein n=1 Tax=Sandaracinus amylolyticus TaxID=927083 RepID=A0A0F6W5D1_9BACT|nr:hypothetical protein [Sandaracinus amylolyticus]AKF07836.1 hypothetical protein DB32_004985 [Sandaracinus amylolyticus]